MRRPGPLKDLPLEPFLHPNSNVPDNLKPFNCPRPNKRPHSPAAPILFSPAKRRILNEEGITFPGKTLRSIPSSRTRLAASSSDFLGDTPAKKLDFGPPKGHQQLVPSIPSCTAEPRSRSPSGSIASSSDISVQPNAIHQPSTSYITLDSDVPSSTTTVPRRSSRLRGSPHSVAPISMPRDMPSPPDRQSIHYPGFDTFQDDHIQYVPLQTNLTASDAFEVGRCTEEMKIDREEYKENVAPRKRTKKGSTAPTSHDLMKIALLTPEAKKKELDSMNVMVSSATSKKSVTRARELGSKQTPRRPTLCTSTLQLSLSPSRVTPDERRERRRLLEDEVNNITDEDDDEGNSTKLLL